MTKKERILAGILIAALAALLYQNWNLRIQVEKLRRQVSNLYWKVDEVQMDIQDIRLGGQTAVIEPQGYFHGWFTHSMVNTKEQYISAQFHAELPGHTEDSVNVQIHTANVLRSSDFETLTRDKNGFYIGSLSFYMDPYAPLKIGIQENENLEHILYETNSLAALLPLKMAWASGDTLYNAAEKKLYNAEWGVCLTNVQGEEVEAENGAYRLYQNGTLVYEGPCFSPDGGKQLEGWGLPCKNGDYVELRYICSDASGIQYEFPLEGWEIQNDKSLRHCPDSLWPEITWP